MRWGDSPDVRAVGEEDMKKHGKREKRREKGKDSKNWPSLSGFVKRCATPEPPDEGTTTRLLSSEKYPEPNPTPSSITPVNTTPNFPYQITGRANYRDFFDHSERLGAVTPTPARSDADKDKHETTFAFKIQPAVPIGCQYL